jgi:meckelin
VILNAQSSLIDKLLNAATGRFNRGFNPSSRPDLAAIPKYDEQVERREENGQIVAHREMTTFLQQFISNGFGPPNLKREVKTPSFKDRMTRQPPPLQLPTLPSVMVPDEQMDYKKVFFLGHEFDFLLMNMLAYVLFDLWFKNTAVSILLTYLLNELLVMIREDCGRSNISTKTLMDDRFLI